MLTALGGVAGALIAYTVHRAVRVRAVRQGEVFVEKKYVST